MVENNYKICRYPCQGKESFVIQHVALMMTEYKFLKLRPKSTINLTCILYILAKLHDLRYALKVTHFTLK